MLDVDIVTFDIFDAAHSLYKEKQILLDDFPHLRIDVSLILAVVASVIHILVVHVEVVIRVVHLLWSVFNLELFVIRLVLSVEIQRSDFLSHYFTFHSCHFLAQLKYNKNMREPKVIIF